ncbi:MAG TPA: hypothetical protein VIK89_12770, partial [Cytophagaceae bacterium]
MKYFNLVLLCLLLLESFVTQAQWVEDSVYGGNDVIINGSRLDNFTAGNKVQVIDSAALSNSASGNLGDLLALHT